MEWVHPRKFGSHRIKSSAELRELLVQNRHSCATHPLLLLYTSLGSIVAGLLHLGLWGRLLPCLLFCALGVASCAFHWYVDVVFEPSSFWHNADKTLAYTGMAYHVFLLANHWQSPLAYAASCICFVSLIFYFRAYAAYENHDFGKYVRIHSLWHVMASLGTILFSMLE